MELPQRQDIEKKVCVDGWQGFRIKVTAVMEGTFRKYKNQGC